MWVHIYYLQCICYFLTVIVKASDFISRSSQSNPLVSLKSSNKAAMARVCILAIFLCAVFATGYVNSNLIRSNDVVENTHEKKEVLPVIGAVAQDIPLVVAPKCKKIGESCINHSDCCTNSCLGYLKRCVS